MMGENWNSRGLTAAKVTGTDGVMVKPCCTEPASMSLLNLKSILAVRATAWSPSATLALTSSGMVSSRTTAASPTRTSGITATHHRRRAPCARLIDPIR